jgi:4-cresol dehydrogenase (hydroxylating)
VPSTGTHALDVADLASAVLLEHAFEPQISISLATERSLIFIITISYDRSVVGADERATRCYRTLTEQLIDRGYPPYRLNVGSMDYVAAVDDAYSATLQRLKHAFDPDGILAPGRYEPRRGRHLVADAPHLVRSTAGRR